MGKATRGRMEQDAADRALRRQIANIERLTGGAFISRAKATELMETQRMLVALVKQLGRVRITDAELDALKDGDSLKAKVDGNVRTLTFEAGAPSPEEDETPPPAEEGERHGEA